MILAPTIEIMGIRKLEQLEFDVAQILIEVAPPPIDVQYSMSESVEMTRIDSYATERPNVFNISH